MQGTEQIYKLAMLFNRAEAMHHQQRLRMIREQGPVRVMSSLGCSDSDDDNGDHQDTLVFE